MNDRAIPAVYPRYIDPSFIASETACTSERDALAPSTDCMRLLATSSGQTRVQAAVVEIPPLVNELTFADDQQTRKMYLTRIRYGPASR